MYIYSICICNIYFIETKFYISTNFYQNYLLISSSPSLCLKWSLRCVFPFWERKPWQLRTNYKNSFPPKLIIILKSGLEIGDLVDFKDIQPFGVHLFVRNKY